ncbi:uncharacterized protein [Amphiura filiformis]|uniref:uncharacterized protein isoform X2 n=1 Tax=Amphiura filiformis TaxID=82378 RepID=UPI003B222F8F
MNVSLYPLMTMTWCFMQPPPSGSVCNCSEAPPEFNITFPVYPTTPGPSTDSIDTTSSDIETRTLYTDSIATTSSGTKTTTKHTANPTIPSDTIPTSDMTTSNSGGGITTPTSSDVTPMSPSAAPVTDDSMSSVAMVTEMETMATDMVTMATDMETTATDMPTMATDNMTTAAGTTKSTNYVGSRTDPDGNEIWPIIVAVIFGVVLVVCIVAFIIWWMKKYGILAQCKVHPDAMHDEEKMTPDMTEVDTLSTDKPPPSNPAAPVAAVGAIGTGAGTPVKKLYKKGSVELKPIGKPLPPIKKGSVILDPSNLTEPETDHPHVVANSNSNNTSNQKPKKKKRKKKKKLSTSEERGDTNLGYENTEDLPDG